MITVVSCNSLIEPTSINSPGPDVNAEYSSIQEVEVPITEERFKYLQEVERPDNESLSILLVLMSILSVLLARI